MGGEEEGSWNEKKTRKQRDIEVMISCVCCVVFCFCRRQSAPLDDDAPFVLSLSL